jgi:hypothetical protein
MAADQPRSGREKSIANPVTCGVAARNSFKVELVVMNFPTMLSDRSLRWTSCGPDTK